MSNSAVSLIHRMNPSGGRVARDIPRGRGSEREMEGERERVPGFTLIKCTPDALINFSRGAANCKVVTANAPADY